MPPFADPGPYALVAEPPSPQPVGTPIKATMCAPEGDGGWWTMEDEDSDKALGGDALINESTDWGGRWWGG